MAPVAGNGDECSGKAQEQQCHNSSPEIVTICACTIAGIGPLSICIFKRFSCDVLLIVVFLDLIMGSLTAEPSCERGAEDCECFGSKCGSARDVHC